MMMKILTFGTFDGLHPGHEHLLSQAAKMGKLTVALAPDQIVKTLKGRLPKRNFDERRSALEHLSTVSKVIKGDEQLGVYCVIQQEQPDVIMLGFDQTALKKDLENWLKRQKSDTKLKILDPFKPEQYKSSLLNSSI